MKAAAAKEVAGLRQHLLTKGPDGMSDMELLGIVIDSPRLARSVVRHTRSWRNAGREELGRIPGFSPGRVAQLLAIEAIAARMGSKPLTHGQAICCSEDVSLAYRPRLAVRKAHEPDAAFAARCIGLDFIV